MLEESFYMGVNKLSVFQRIMQLAEIMQPRPLSMNDLRNIQY